MSSVISGSVVEARTRSPLVGATILAILVDEFFGSETLIGGSVVGADGAFSFSYRDPGSIPSLGRPTKRTHMVLAVQDRDGEEAFRTEPIRGEARLEPQSLVVDISPPDRRPIVSGTVTDGRSGSPLVGANVHAFTANDRDENGELIGRGVVDTGGAFEITYSSAAPVRQIVNVFPRFGPDIVLVVIEDGKEVHRTEPIRGAARFEPRELVIGLPKREPPRLEELIEVSGLSPNLTSRLYGSGIKDLGSLLRAKAQGRLPDVGGLSGADAEKLGSVGRWAALGGSASLAGKMATAGLLSPASILRTSPSALYERLVQGGARPNNKDFEALSRLKRNTVRVSRRVGQAGVAAARATSADKTWLGGYDAPAKVLGAETDDDLLLGVEGRDNRCRECDACDAIFSPSAYAHDLLAFIEDNYGIEPRNVGKIINQELDLDCEAALAPIKQIVLGIESLENYADSELSLTAELNDWQDNFSAGAVSLLALIDVDVEASPLSSEHEALAKLAKTISPKLSTIMELREKVLTFGTRAIEKALPLPPEPDAAADDETEAAFDMESAQVEAQRATRLADLQSRIEAHVDPMLVLYRLALVDGLVADPNAPGSQAALELNLFIDLAAAPCQLTSRILQVIQSVQSLLLSVRTGGFKSLQRATLSEFRAAFDQGDFDEESWVWLKTYRSWNAAIYALVYTENILSPPVERRRVSGFFRDQVVSRLLRGQASAREIEALDEDYAHHFARIGEIRPITSHVIGDRLYIFARTGQSGEYACWMNIINTRDLYVPGADEAAMRGRPIDAAGWFEVFGWDPGQRPTMAMPFGDGEDLAFIALGSNHTYHIEADGRLKGEVPFESPPSNRNLTLSADHSFGPHVPTLWIQGDEANTWHHATFDQSSTEWGEWSAASRAQPWFRSVSFDGIGLADTLIGNTPCRVGRDDGKAVVLSFRRPSTDPKPSVKKRLNWLEGRQSFGNYSVSLSWMRSQLDLPGFLIVNSTNGESFVQAVWLTTDITDPSFMLQISNSLAAYTNVLTWPDSIDVSHATGGSTDLRDRYFYYPLLAGWALNSAGDFVNAHECYRRLYDPFVSSREVFPFRKAFTGELEKGDDWLATIQDPDAIARQRSGTYLRHTILMMVKNLIDWADHQYAQNTPESLNRARDLYRLAETVLDAPALETDCAAEITRLERRISRRFAQAADTIDSFSQGSSPVVLKIRELRKIDDRNIVRRAIEGINSSFSASDADLRRSIRKAVSSALNAQLLDLAIEQGRDGSRVVKLLDRLRRTRQSVERFLDFGIAGRARGEVVADARGTGLDDAPPPIGAAVFAFCVPKNPLMDQLALHIKTRQLLLANCLDINGEPNRRTTQPIGSLQGRVITTFGQLAAQAAGPIVEAPHYRYSFLVEKARQYASLAQQLEAMMLAAIEKRDAAALAVLQAEIAEELADATVDLKALTRSEVELAVDVARAQQQRANKELNFWQNRNNNGFMGLNAAEQAGMGLMATSGVLQGLAASGYFLLAGPQTLLGIASGVGGIASGVGGIATATTGWGALGGAGGVIAGGAGIGLAAITGGQTILSGVQAAAGAAGTFGNLSLTFASFERRWEDWRHQFDLASIDLNIADQQVNLSESRVDVALQDEAIAELQQGHAELIIEFHRNRFSNEQLYQWMIGVLQGAYRDVMQRATATAQLAQRALMFERQEEITEIVGDYWSINESALSEGQRASGLLGAERLLTAITRLDEWKIKTDKRRLQLEKTVSLAHTFPSEFIEFRQTGRIQFHTLTDWFDQDYPGHYLRLIKSVRVAVLALVSPLDGIRATLSNDGFSTVVKPSGAGTFVNLPAVQRLPQQVALDAAGGDNGLFVLDYNDPLLLPFEGLGVETGWNFELPRAANSFNYDSLADVLVTIEYTALPSPAYRQQVIARLGTKRRIDRVISLRDSFPDQWYHLHNPLETSEPLTARIDLPAYFFQQSRNEPLGIRHMMVILVGPAGVSRSGDLRISKSGISPALSVVTDNDGLFNTRNGARPGDDGLPRPRFALDPDDPNKLLAPNDVGEEAKLVDPRGEWALSFDPVWFAGSDDKRPIDSLTDVILIPTLEYDVSW